MHWLDRNGFAAVHQLLAGQGCEELVMLRSVPTRDAIGVVHAVSTRAGEAQTLDGQALYALNPLDSHVGAPPWKIGSATVWDGRVRGFVHTVLVDIRAWLADSDPDRIS